MSQLTFASIPGFFDLADSAIAAGQPLTDDSISKISHNAKFGVVRAEQFYMGFYANGNTVAAPVSPVDGYAYSYAECLFFLIHSSSLSGGIGRSSRGFASCGRDRSPTQLNSCRNFLGRSQMRARSIRRGTGSAPRISTSSARGALRATICRSGLICCIALAINIPGLRCRRFIHFRKRASARQLRTRWP